MRKILPVINTAPGVCLIAQKAARMLQLTMITFDQAETQLYADLQARGRRMNLAEISRLKNEYLEAVGNALSLGLAVSPLAIRDASEFGLFEMRSELRPQNHSGAVSKPQEKSTISKPKTPFPGFQKY